MRASAEAGQVAVETAIVLPLFVFLILGTLQLGLMHQARLLTKYAAYKAVRAGSLHHADIEEMEKAAAAVLLPVLSQDGGGGAERIAPTSSASDFTSKWNALGLRNEMSDVSGMKYVEVIICGPLREDVGSGRELDFDNPTNAAGTDWKTSERTKLRIQTTLNYRMPIPFADMVIYNIVRARDVPFVLRLGKEDTRTAHWGNRSSNPAAAYDAAADKRLYILPIRATYTMRMHSNFYLTENPLPTRNQCIFTF